MPHSLAHPQPHLHLQHLLLQLLVVGQLMVLLLLLLVLLLLPVSRPGLAAVAAAVAALEGMSHTWRTLRCCARP